MATLHPPRLPLADDSAAVINCGVDSQCCATSDTSLSSASSLCSLSRQSSSSLSLLDWCNQQQAAQSHASHAPRDPRTRAKALNSRLMAAHTPQEILGIVEAHLAEMDSINSTAALQRLARLLAGGQVVAQPQKEALAALMAEPVFQALAGLIVAQSASGAFNAQSTANAWWALARLHAPEHPVPAELAQALQVALVLCLRSARDADHPNAQATSSIWHSWGRIACAGGADGFCPSRAAAELLWERTQRLCLAFDSQGVSNMIWAFGLLRRRHGDGFALHIDVLASLASVADRLAPSFTVQGLSCTAVGCANMGHLRAVLLPVMRTVVAQSLASVAEFNLQAMANTATAISKLGPELAAEPATRALLAAFDAHAARLPHVQKPQEAVALLTALKTCGAPSTRFSVRLAAAAGPLGPPPGLPHRHQHQQAGSGLRDATNRHGSHTAASAGTAAPDCAVPAHHLAALRALAGLPPAVRARLPSPPPLPQEQQPWQSYLPPASSLPNDGAAAAPQRHDRPPPPPQPAMGPAAALAGPLPHQQRPPPGAFGGPLTISEYAALARQLQYSCAVGLTGGSMSAPVLAESYTPSSAPHYAYGGPQLQSAYGGAYGGAGQQVQAQPPPPPPPGAPAGAPQPCSTDPAHLQALLQALLLVKQESEGVGGRPAS